jgi:hypothetical protein
MERILLEIRHQLKLNIDDKTLQSSQHFFKEQISAYGVKVPLVNKISREYFKVIQGFPKHQIFQLCDELFNSGFLEESFIACNWSYYIRENYEPDDFLVFEKKAPPGNATHRS